MREVGPGFTTLEPGQRVVAYTPGGGLAEVARTRAEFVVPLPDQVALPIAAAAPLMLTTALLLLTDAARFRPGDSVLVHGASGGVGSAVAQLVPALGGGLRIGTVGRPDSVAAALANGYDVALAWTEDVPAAVRAATNGVGADIVLDPQGTVLLDTDLAVTAPGGRIVLFGNAGGGEPAPLPPVGRLIGGNLAIGGFSITGLWANAPHRASRPAPGPRPDRRRPPGHRDHRGRLAGRGARGAAAAGRGPGPRQVRHPRQGLIPGARRESSTAAAARNCAIRPCHRQARNRAVRGSNRIQ